jgi:SAM-dependent methyltransferase
MHPANRILSCFGVKIVRMRKNIPPEVRELHSRCFKALQENPSGFRIFVQEEYDAMEHPENHTDFECTFAALQLKRINPSNVLDIGSYRLFILGMLAYYKVVTIDVRSRKPVLNNETVVTCDAKVLTFPDASFDVVVSLCALHHFGLGRYGDEFDIEGDRKAFKEMVRVLRPGGHIIFATTFTRGEPSICFNAHRIYDMDMIRKFCSGLDVVDERFYSGSLQRGCAISEVTDKPGIWDVYCGCWKKR